MPPFLLRPLSFFCAQDCSWNHNQEGGGGAVLRSTNFSPPYLALHRTGAGTALHWTTSSCTTAPRRRNNVLPVPAGSHTVLPAWSHTRT